MKNQDSSKVLLSNALKVCAPLQKQLILSVLYLLKQCQGEKNSSVIAEKQLLLPIYLGVVIYKQFKVHHSSLQKIMVENIQDSCQLSQ